MRWVHAVHRATITACAVAAMVSSDLAAQSACRTADERSGDIIEVITRYVTATDGDNALARDALQLPSASASEVELVTADSVCTLAATAYNQDRQGEGSGLSGRVYVIKVRTVYVVHDPEYVYNPASPGGFVILLFNSSWQRIASM